jgi:mRNA-degrading endonuclease RelE of RelBE toxin-antitoxin system
VKTVIETPAFQKLVDKIWSEEERLEFISWLVKHPNSGDVIPGAEGARKIRWSIKGSGKRGGVRVVYFNVDQDGVIYLVMIYRKAKKNKRIKYRNKGG